MDIYLIIVCGNDETKMLVGSIVDNNLRGRRPSGLRKTISSHNSLAQSIIRTGVGKEKIITDQDIKREAILIDVGINGGKDDKKCGDIDFEKVVKKWRLITPEPRGVGRMTVTMMILNLLNATNVQNKKTSN